MAAHRSVAGVFIQEVNALVQITISPSSATKVRANDVQKKIEILRSIRRQLTLPENVEEDPNVVLFENNEFQDERNQELENSESESSNVGFPEAQSSQHSDVTDTAKKTDRPVVWTDEMVQLLIVTRLDLEEEFSKPGSRKRLWRKVASLINKHKYSVSADECDSKWRNLMATYRKNKDKANRSGEGCVTWKFYELMNDGLQMKPNITPPEGTLISSLEDDTDGDISQASPSQKSRHSSGVISTSSGSLSPPQSADRLLSFSTPASSSSSSKLIPNPPKHRLKRMREENPPWVDEYFKMRKEEDAKMEGRWQELKEIENKKLSLLQQFVDVLKK